MIAYIYGKVIYSDGEEVILLTDSGLGLKICFSSFAPIGQKMGLYLTHVFKEMSQELYGFKSILEQKTFEWLLKVKGVGPKSAYSLIKFLGTQAICEAIKLENKKVLQQAPGIGPKVASQIILDLKEKISHIQIHLKNVQDVSHADSISFPQSEFDLEVARQGHSPQQHDNSTLLEKYHNCLNEALMACKELGFVEKEILPLAQKIMNEKKIYEADKLVQMLLKEI